MQTQWKMKNTVNQIIESFTFLKDAKRSKKMQELEEMLRQAQHDKRLPRRSTPRNDGNRPFDKLRVTKVTPSPLGEGRERAARDCHATLAMTNGS